MSSSSSSSSYFGCSIDSNHPSGKRTDSTDESSVLPNTSIPSPRSQTPYNSSEKSNGNGSVVMTGPERIQNGASISSIFAGNESILSSKGSILPRLSHHKYRSPSLPANSLMTPSIQIPSSLRIISSKDLQELLSSNPDSTSSPQSSEKVLIVDVRPFTQYSTSRIKTAINVCIPSTLLKRPTFTLDRFGECMAPSQRSSLEKLDQYDYVIIYDQSTDKISPTTCSPIAYTILKFSKAESLKGNIYYLLGGFSACAAAYPDLVNGHPIDMSKLSEPTRLPQSLSLSSNNHNLTNATKKRSQDNLGHALSPSKDDSSIGGPHMHLGAPQTFDYPPVLTGFSLPLKAIQDGPMKPFVSNLRSNSLESLDYDLSPLNLPPDLSSDEVDTYFPLWLRDLIDPDVGPQKIARRFHDIEQAEKVRLQTAFSQAVKKPVSDIPSSNVFSIPSKTHTKNIDNSTLVTGSNQDVKNPPEAQTCTSSTVCINTSHATCTNTQSNSEIPNKIPTIVVNKDSGDNLFLGSGFSPNIINEDCCEPITPDDTQIKYSFSAGVELGAKNRYSNIWPYDHTRVRLPETFTEKQLSSIDSETKFSSLDDSNESSNVDSETNDTKIPILNKNRIDANSLNPSFRPSKLHTDERGYSPVEPNFCFDSNAPQYLSKTASSSKHSHTLSNRHLSLSSKDIVPSNVDSPATSPKSAAYLDSKPTVKLSPESCSFSFGPNLTSVVTPSSLEQKTNDQSNSPISTNNSSFSSATTSITTSSTANTSSPASATSATASQYQHDNGTNDYFNASYISPKGSRNRYIATQGPLPDTFSDFWHVVWDKKIPLIVMLTSETEGGHIKCHKYWNSNTYGKLKLELLEEKEVELASRTQNLVTVRKFSLTPISIANLCTNNATNTKGRLGAKDGVEPIQKPVAGHIVVQIQYSSWPDLGSPASPDDLIAICKLKDDHLNEVVPQVKTSDKDNSGSRLSPTTLAIHSNNCRNSDVAQLPKPWVLVHCSAGCGRTGTFCTVDSVVDMLREYGMSVVPKSRRVLKARDQTSAKGSTFYSAYNKTSDFSSKPFPLTLPLSTAPSTSAAAMASIFATASVNSNKPTKAKESSYFSVPGDNPTVTLPRNPPSLATSASSFGAPLRNMNLLLPRKSIAEGYIPSTPSTTQVPNPFSNPYHNPLVTPLRNPNFNPFRKPSDTEDLSSIIGTPTSIKPESVDISNPASSSRSFNGTEAHKSSNTTKAFSSNSETIKSTKTSNKAHKKTDSDFESYDLIYRTVHDFRRQRLSMVQMLCQYVLCYETIILWVHQQYLSEKAKKEDKES